MKNTVKIITMTRRNHKHTSSNLVNAVLAHAANNPEIMGITIYINDKEIHQDCVRRQIYKYTKRIRPNLSTHTETNIFFREDLYTTFTKGDQA